MKFLSAETMGHRTELSCEFWYLHLKRSVNVENKYDSSILGSGCGLKEIANLWGHSLWEPEQKWQIKSCDPITEFTVLDCVPWEWTWRTRAWAPCESGEICSDAGGKETPGACRYLPCSPRASEAEGQRSLLVKRRGRKVEKSRGVGQPGTCP